jgi:YfiH family protein
MPEAVIQSRLFCKIPGIQHGFTTRATSAELNAKLEAKVSTGKQIHKDTIFWPSSYERRTTHADGVGTLTPNFYVGAYSADCTPVLLALTSKSRILGVMAVHAGWRGTALQIAEKAVRALFDKTNSGDSLASLKLYAVIGPCIGFDSFEVSDDVIQAFPDALSLGLARKLRVENGKQKYQFNLPGENLRQVEKAAWHLGLKLESDHLGLCTVADPGLFPSFRRDHESAGRILSYIAFGTDHLTGA